MIKMSLRKRQEFILNQIVEITKRDLYNCRAKETLSNVDIVKNTKILSAFKRYCIANYVNKLQSYSVGNNSHSHSHFSQKFWLLRH